MTQEEKDLGALEEQVAYLIRWVDNADKNHFPTIEKRFDKIEQKLARYSGGIAVAVLIGQLLLKLID